MKLIAVEMSRLTTLFRGVRSTGQLYLPRAATMLAGRYKFVQSPQSYEDLTADRIEFRHGEFDGCAVESLEVYNDGMIVSSRSNTDLLDKFFGDLTEWMGEEFGWTIIKTHAVDRIYESVLEMQAETDVLSSLQSLSGLARLIERGLKETSALEVEYQPLGWALATDPTGNPALKPVAFRLERRLGVEFAMQHYLSAAPLRTRTHIELLEFIETLA